MYDDSRFKCLTGSQREQADKQLGELAECQFVLDSQDAEFVEHCLARTHVHWPMEWGTRLAEIHDRVFG